MKTLNYLLIMIFLQIPVVNGFAQEYKEKRIVKDGDITFITFKEWGDNISYQRAGTENLIPESYEDVYLRTPNNFPEVIENEFFQEIFSKERAIQLSNGKLICRISYNGIKKEIAYVEFRWAGEGDFPLTLKELDLLERKFKSYPFIYDIQNTEKKNRFSAITYPILFDKLYR